MFEFEGDTFSATAVVAIIRRQNEVKIYVWADPEEFNYPCGPAIAERKKNEAVAAWRRACGPEIVR